MKQLNKESIDGKNIIFQALTLIYYKYNRINFILNI